MKKLLALSIVAAFFAVPSAFAGNSAGCGLGSQLFAGDSGLVANVLAATTNGLSGNQTFGMTSGTSNCNANDTVMNEVEQQEFVAVNYENLSTDMAIGEGQYLDSLSTLMGCPAAVHGEFSRMSKENYEQLFGAPEMDAKAWLDGLKAEMAKDPVLSANCTRVS